MKAIQVLMDEALLRRLDSDEEVQKHGRSAVLRRAAAEYLRRSRSRRIAAALTAKTVDRREIHGLGERGFVATFRIETLV
jgi:metal-responsive CopG/Arc/MetJ family transcriptional regulator